MSDLVARPTAEPRFGEYHCDLPGYETVWVRFQPRGYPFALRRQWRETNDDNETLQIVFDKVEAGTVVDLNGKLISLLPGEAHPVSLLDGVEGAVVIWLIQTFTRFLFLDSSAPPKNLLPPSIGA